MANDHIVLLVRFITFHEVDLHRHRCVWVGLSDIAGRGEWIWVDGEEASSTWKKQQGSRMFGMGRCGVLRGGYLTTEDCKSTTRLCSFLCERKIF